ncbi:MAG TPA: TA system VapC family ribonuclease toxin [Terriglobia bacterium]|nr:TA system VapC family ribonuclease toxin [Terriglobia bacterium]
MKYLLDVNVLVAWGWADHVDHERTAIWIASVRKGKHWLITAPIPELGFVRVSTQRAGGRVSVAEAVRTLRGMLASLGPRHVFLPDDMPIDVLPVWCHHPARTTDAHLLQLAESHGAILATLDTGIPDAFLIPVATARRR